MAFVWPLIDDNPLNLDMLLQSSGLSVRAGHVFLEILFHLLTIFFLFLTMLEATKGGRVGPGVAIEVSSLVFLAFTLVNFDDFALYLVPLQFLRDPALFNPTSAATKLFSFVPFLLALYVSLRRNPD